MKTDLYNGYKVNLIESIDELDSVLQTFNPKVLCGGDCETTGLSYLTDRVVGFCMSGGRSYSKQDYAGYYIPLRHSVGDNLPIDEVRIRIQNFIDNYKTCWWNRTFDASMLEFDGIKIPFVGKMHDGQIMAHLAFSEPYPALKDTAKNLMNFDVIEFSSNNAKDHNFGTTDPNISFRYAAQDPLITVLLAQKIWNEYPYIRKIYPLDNKVAEAVRKFCNTTILTFDQSVILNELDQVDEEIATVKNKIFAITGYQFKLNSTADKADALSRFVTLTAKTKSGKFATDKETLSKINHPLAKLLVEYNELRTYRDSFVAKMAAYPKEGVHINYSTCNVATGRMSSGGSEGNPFFAPQNIQNVPKVQKSRYVHTDPQLGYILNDIEEGAIGTMEAKSGLRDAFIPPEGYVWMCADYGQEELRMIGNLSGEVNLVDPINNGEDIHTYVAKKMFGFSDKKHRTRVKTLNFAVAYGANEFTIARKLDIPVDEAKTLLDNYFATMAQFSRWKAETIKNARRQGFVFTYFGRPRLLYKYYNSSDRSLHSFADRTAVNSPVQGFGGDLIRIDHIKLYQKFLDDKEFADNVKYALTVHDEINLFVKPTYLSKAFIVLRDLMYFNPDNFKVPIIAEPSVGTCWGTQVEAERVNENNHIIINRDKIDPMPGHTMEELNEFLDKYEATL